MNPGHTGKKAIYGRLDRTGTTKCWSRQSSAERADDKIIEISDIITTHKAHQLRKKQKKKNAKKEREKQNKTNLCPHPGLNTGVTLARKPYTAV